VLSGKPIHTVLVEKIAKGEMGYYYVNGKLKKEDKAVAAEKIVKGEVDPEFSEPKFVKITPKTVKSIKQKKGEYVSVPIPSKFVSGEISTDKGSGLWAKIKRETMRGKGSVAYIYNDLFNLEKSVEKYKRVKSLGGPTLQTLVRKW